MKNLIYLVIGITILYYIKVPTIVNTIDNIREPLINSVAYIIDVSTHLRERHPFVFMSMFPLLLFLMRKGD